jgi:glycolate oxidase iron-sulfur subunit
VETVETPAIEAAHPERSYVDLIADCVHCGFCLPACPTYLSWGDEMDSPRGRIDLMKAVDEGSIALDASVVGHLDACLGCMACVTACPSGVRYDLLIESTRAKVEASYPRPVEDRAFRDLIFALFPYPDRLRVMAYPLWFAARSGLQKAIRALGLPKLLPKRLAELEALAPDLTRDELTSALPVFTAARGERRGRVAVIAGCVQRVFFPEVNASTVRVLSAEGYDVLVPEGQGCCGALSLHAGREPEAKRFAEALITRFEYESFDRIIINAAGCGSTLKGYGELFAAGGRLRDRAQRFAEKVVDVNEFLASIEPRAPRGPIRRRVAYHDACHLSHAQRIRAQPRALLRGIPGIDLLDVPAGDQCCGSAGVYNLLQPDSAREIGERKADNVLSVAPDILASANPGCTLQIVSILRERGVELEAMHPIQLLDRSLQAAAGR